MGQTVVEKIAQRTWPRGRPGARCAPVTSCPIRPHHVMTHDNTAPVMKKFKAHRRAARSTIRASRSSPWTTTSRTAPRRTWPSTGRSRSSRRAGRRLLPRRNGHRPPGDGRAAVRRPGAFVVASDSHSNMYGAMGAVGTPVVRTDAAAIWATGTFWWQIPRTVQVRARRRASRRCDRQGRDHRAVRPVQPGRGAQRGGGVRRARRDDALSMDERTGHRQHDHRVGRAGGLVPRGRRRRSSSSSTERELLRLGRRAPSGRRGHVARLDRRADPPRPDADASTPAGSISTCRRSPRTSRAPTPCRLPLRWPRSRRERIASTRPTSSPASTRGSRTSGRRGRGARGRRVADGVEFYVAAASREVQAEAERRGAWQTLLDAGARSPSPGCGPCIGLGAPGCSSRARSASRPPTATSRAAWAPATRSATWPARRWSPPRRRPPGTSAARRTERP